MRKISFKMIILFALFLMLSVFYNFRVYAKSNIKIGVYLSMTGPIAAWGRVEWQGIEVAHELFPSIKGKHIELVLEDVASKPEGAALAAERLVSSNIKFVVGPVTSFAALAALPIFDKYGVVDVIPTANARNLTLDRKFASRVCFNNYSQARVMADYIYSNGYKRGVVIENLSQDYSVDLTKNFIERFRRDGGIVEKVFYISNNDTDFSVIATQIKDMKPQFVYFTTYYNPIALMLRDLKMMGCKAKMFAGSAASSYVLVKIAGKASEGLVFTDDFDPLVPQTNIGKKFIRLFEQRFHRMPDSPEALAADAYLLLVKAIEKEGENPQKVARFVRNTTFYGITGKIIIRDGVVRRTIVLRRIENDTFKPVAVFEP